MESVGRIKANVSAFAQLRGDAITLLFRPHVRDVDAKVRLI
jgi:hypothetical protein